MKNRIAFYLSILNAWKTFKKLGSWIFLAPKSIGESHILADFYLLIHLLLINILKKLCSNKWTDTLEDPFTIIENSNIELGNKHLTDWLV
jgi:hypothetical protein